jgi:hypothetical protein
VKSGRTGPFRFGEAAQKSGAGFRNLSAAGERQERFEMIITEINLKFLTFILTYF